MDLYSDKPDLYTPLHARLLSFLYLWIVSPLIALWVMLVSTMREHLTARVGQIGRAMHTAESARRGEASWGEALRGMGAGVRRRGDGGSGESKEKDNTQRGENSKDK